MKTTTASSSPIPPKRTGSRLVRELAVLSSVFVLLASLALVGWMTWLDQRASLNELRMKAANNAAFISELRLPRSRELASRFSQILGMELAFQESMNFSPDIPESVREVLSELGKSQTPRATRVRDLEIAVAPIPGETTSLFLVRTSSSLISRVASLALVPTAMITLAAALLAFRIGRGIVTPLRRLTEWTPNLESADVSKIPRPPAPISSRPDEIGELSRALSGSLDRLEVEQELRRRSERLATLGRIATSLAHEIRNPAAAIGLHADILLQDKTGPDRDSLRLIRDEVDRITDLVNQWLFVAKAEPSGMSRQNLSELVEEVSRRMKPVFSHAQTSISLMTPEACVPVNIDRPRIEQVIRNLLLNASQAMPSGGAIRVILDRKNDEATLTVEDEGAGLSEEAKHHFGEPFFTEREGGMGLGLTLARDVLHAHGGRIAYGTSPSGGAAITCHLPLATAEEK